MTALLMACAVLGLGGILALLLSQHPRWSGRIGAGTMGTAALLGVWPCIRAIVSGTAQSVRYDWNLPGAAFFLKLDALAAVFLLPVLVLGALAAIYALGYMRSHERQKPVGWMWFCFNGLVLCMAMVLLARNAVLFLLAWEGMALTSFFLVIFDYERPQVKEAGWIYLVATHLGTAFLIVFFALLARETGGLDFGENGMMAQAAPTVANLAFVCALIGFGAKAGFVPMHVWLPEAHPAAPSHVSAVMSGVMIKTGVYGVIRALTLFGTPPLWWGWALVFIGAASGVLGILYALAQHDFKRLLAYSSVENIGIIALGLGLGVLGMSVGRPELAQLGFAGALIHVVNHAVFKGLLFFGAGAVLHATGTRDLEHLGGLLKKMPWTGALFLVGAAAISGLPPFNGFIGEFFIYYGALTAFLSPDSATAWPFVLIVGALALIGGLAAAGFARAFGIVFLGEPRSDQARSAHEVEGLMRWPMLALGATCLLLALAAPWLAISLKPALALLTDTPPAGVFKGVNPMGVLGWIWVGSVALISLAGLLAVWRRWLLKGRVVSSGPTWDCGYVASSARIQYTASSFSQPFVNLFRLFLRTRRRHLLPEGIFPSRSYMSTETPDGFQEKLFAPVFERARWALSQLRWSQQGRLQVYVLYMALTLVGLMIWWHLGG